MLGWVHAAVGDTDTALPMFEQLVEAHDPHAAQDRIPAPATARHPRFAALITTVGFPP